MLRQILPLATLMLLTSCASMFGNDSDQLTIHSNDPNAKIMVDGNVVGTGSTTYTLPRGKTAVIKASKEGCQDRSVTTGRSIVGATWFNILFWPGFIVDAVTGDMHKANPTNYSVTPICKNPV